MKTEKKEMVGVELVTPQELAARLGVSRATVARWKSAGCPFVETRPYTLKRFTRPRYNVGAVIAWLQDDKKGDKA